MYVAKSIKTILCDGLDSWYHNPLTAVPFVLDVFASLALSAVFYLIFIVFAILFGFGASAGGLYSGSWDLGSFLGILSVIVLIVLIFVCYSVLGLSSAFFQGGGIMMIKLTALTGKSRMADMVQAGKKYFLRLFLSRMVRDAILILGFILLIFTYVLAGVAFGDNELVNIFMLLVFVLGFSLFYLIFRILFVLADYCVVLGDYGVIDSLKASVGYFSANRMNVFLMWLITSAVLFCLTGTNVLISVLVGLIPFIGFFINLGLGLLFSILVAAVLRPVYAFYWVAVYETLSGDKTLPLRSESLPEDDVRQVIFQKKIEEESQ